MKKIISAILLGMSVISISSFAVSDTKNDNVLTAKISDKAYGVKCTFTDEKNKLHETTHFFYKGKAYFLFTGFQSSEFYYMTSASYKMGKEKLSGTYDSGNPYEYNFKTKQFTSKTSSFGTIVEECDVTNGNMKDL